MPERKTIVRRATEGFCAWCADTGDAARLERTVVQGVIAAVAVGVTTGEWGASVVTAAIMAVITPIQAAIGRTDNKADGDVR